MKFSPEILQELSNISPLLAGVERKNTLSVPEGYFDSLTLDLIKNLSFDNKEKLTVPKGYFDNLGEQILQEIKSLEIDASPELRTLSPMLYSIKNENVFAAPERYFDDLSENILTKIITKPQAKVIPLKRRDSVWKIAAAAVVTGIIAVSSIMVFNHPQQSTSDELAVATYIKEASQYKNEKQIYAGVASLSDDDIIKYLEKTGNDADNETLVTGVNEKALPDQKDYLLDEHTLDTYLNNIEKSTKN